MTADEAEPMSLLIHELGLAEAILRDHIADPTGEFCVKCSRNLTVKWPCPLRFYANEARELDDTAP